MLNIDLNQIAEEAKSRFNFYVPGDMKKLTKFLKSKGLDIVSIQHHTGGMTTYTTVTIWVCDPEYDTLTTDMEIIWD